MIYIGIDPGASGGMSFLMCDGPRIVDVTLLPMPDNDQDLLDKILDQGRNCHAILEQVGGYVGEGQPGSAMFKFGEGYGKLKMALTAAKIPYELVTPQRWQKQYSLSRKKGEKKGPWKNRIKEVACRLFPQEKVTLATCDALLIAEYCRRKHTGTLLR